MNSFSFYLSEKFFVSPSILNDNFAGLSILDCRFFLFRTLNISCPTLFWPVKFLQKNHQIVLWGFPCIWLFVFLLLPLEFPFFSFTFAVLNYDMSWYVSVWVHLVWDPLCFLYLDIRFLLQVWEIFSHNFTKYVLDPLLSLLYFWGPYNVNVGMLHFISEIS